LAWRRQLPVASDSCNTNCNAAATATPGAATTTPFQVAKFAGDDN